MTVTRGQPTPVSEAVHDASVHAPPPIAEEAAPPRACSPTAPPPKRALPTRRARRADDAVRPVDVAHASLDSSFHGYTSAARVPPPSHSQWARTQAPPAAHAAVPPGSEAARGRGRALGYLRRRAHRSCPLARADAARGGRRLERGDARGRTCRHRGGGAERAYRWRPRRCARGGARRARGGPSPASCRLERRSQHLAEESTQRHVEHSASQRAPSTRRSSSPTRRGGGADADAQRRAAVVEAQAAGSPSRSPPRSARGGWRSNSRRSTRTPSARAPQWPPRWSDSSTRRQAALEESCARRR